jgi:hypothetical protein
MDQLTVCTPFLFSPKDPWAVSSSKLTIKGSLKISISTPTYILEMHHRISTAPCIQVSRHEKKTVKNKIERAVIKRIKHLLEERQHSISEDQSTDAIN